MLIEATLLGLAILTWKNLGKKEEWTAEREAMYQSALEHLRGPAGVAKLREIADECEKHGFHAKAYALRKRAELREAGAKLRRARHEAFLKGMKSQNIDGIRKLADAFEGATLVAACRRLRLRADRLEHGEPDVFEDSEMAPPAQAKQAESQPQAEEPKTAPASPRAKAPSAPDLPEEAPAVPETRAPIPAEVPEKRQAQVKSFDTREQAIAAVNGRQHVEVTPIQEGSDVAEAG